MASHLSALNFAARDPAGLARFWAGVLGREIGVDDATLRSSDGTEFPIRFMPTHEDKTGPNRMHFDLTSTSLEDQQQTVLRAVELGARHIDIGQLPEEGHVVLADPEGNEFCVIEPGNNFLADTARIGALSCDGSQAAGYFWAEALGWPLVWDQDEETAIQSPQGGSKISWGGPPVGPKTGTNRLRLELTPPAGTDQQAEIDRLLSLGASRRGSDPMGANHAEMVDLDGNEFSVCRPPSPA